MLADAENQLESFVRLDAPDNAGKRANRSTFRTRGDEPRRRRRWVLATQARASIEIENSNLAFELVNRTEYERNAVQGTRIVNQVTRLVIVGTVNYQIVAVNLLQDIRCFQLDLFGLEHDILVDVLDLVLYGSDFRALDIARPVQHLALQVLKRNFLEIDDLDSANPCCCKVLDNRRAERACTNDHDLCGFDALLALDPDFTEHQVLAEAFDFAVVK